MSANNDNVNLVILQYILIIAVLRYFVEGQFNSWFMVPKALVLTVMLYTRVQLKRTRFSKITLVFQNYLIDVTIEPYGNVFGSLVEYKSTDSIDNASHTKTEDCLVKYHSIYKSHKSPWGSLFLWHLRTLDRNVFYRLDDTTRYPIMRSKI